MSTGLKIGLCAALLLICCWRLFSVLNPAPQAAPFHMELGTFAGETCEALIEDNATVVVLMKEGKRPLHRRQVKAFSKQLSKAKSAELIEEVLQPPELEEGDMLEFQVSNGGFAEALKRHPKADLVVSFAGAPDLDVLEKAWPGSDRPSFVVVGMPRGIMEPLLNAGWVDIAIASKGGLVSETRPSSRREWVDTFYEVLRP